MNNFKVSIITISYNNVSTILDTIKSVGSQTYSNIEYIVVDGASNDGTLNIIKKNQDIISKYISETDEGIYDAMNKGIQLATGEIVGILNADDFFYNKNTLASVVEAFNKYNVEAIFGDIVFVSDSNHDKVIRYYSAKKWHPDKFVWGYMPPHPSFFAKSDLYKKFGLFKTDYHIAADYELLIRFLKVNEVKYKYLPIVTTKMRMGGASTKNLYSNYLLNKEIIRACKENGLYTNVFMVYSKYIKKIFEFIVKR
ncbi:glycosyltransferase family 2 protein [Chondrinema litorale]|uniref:glycosyltransferase family 2 protein n=1 Tax=Chondrinema litorale TaxID=2994555 RepID=UPI0025438634|nr:glycosyltransferase family 2 protein [Chondrinema litorale]UZR95489.1 glycosyltransferase family 2 protein [Chondrinema litorale]